MERNRLDAIRVGSPLLQGLAFVLSESHREALDALAANRARAFGLTSERRGHVLDALGPTVLAKRKPLLAKSSFCFAREAVVAFTRKEKRAVDAVSPEI